MNALLPVVKGIARTGGKAYKLVAQLPRGSSIDKLSFRLLSEWQDPVLVLCAEVSSLMVEPPSLFDDLLPQSLMGEVNSLQRFLYHGNIMYLPSNYLCKLDCFAIFTSLETRVSFLDHRVPKLACLLPLVFKIRGKESRRTLSQVFYKNVQCELVDRPKAGFNSPVGQWKRWPLWLCAENLPDEKRLLREGYIYQTPIRLKWNEHFAERGDHTTSLCIVQMFQALLEAQN